MRILLFILLLLGFLHPFAQYPFSLSGTAPGGFNNMKLRLIVEDNYSNHKYKFEDTVTIRNNRFSFTGTIKKPSEKASLLLYNDAKTLKGQLYFVVDTGLHTMAIQLLPPKWPFYKNKLSNTVIFNSPSNTIKKALDSLSNHYYLTKGKPAADNKNIIELDAAIRTALRQNKLALLKQYPHAFYTILRLYDEMTSGGGFRTGEAAALYEALDTQLQSSVLGGEIRERIAAARSIEMGSAVTVFTIQKSNGDTFSNSSLKDSVYLLAFGATWCAPCKERIPMLNQLYEKYKRYGFQIVYVNLDEKTPLWKQQIEQYKMGKWINVSEGVKWEASTMVKRFNIKFVPFYLLVNKAGIIVYNLLQLNDTDYQQLEKIIIANLK